MRLVQVSTKRFVILDNVVMIELHENGLATLDTNPDGDRSFWLDQDESARLLRYLEGNATKLT